MTELFDILQMITIIGGASFLQGPFFGRSFLHCIRKGFGYVWGPKYLKYRGKKVFKRLERS